MPGILRRTGPETDMLQGADDGVRTPMRAFPTPETAKCELARSRTGLRKSSIFERLVEESDDLGNATRKRIEAEEGYVSHLTHGSAGFLR